MVFIVEDWGIWPPLQRTEKHIAWHGEVVSRCKAADTAGRLIHGSDSRWEAGELGKDLRMSGMGCSRLVIAACWYVCAGQHTTYRDIGHFNARHDSESR